MSFLPIRIANTRKHFEINSVLPVCLHSCTKAFRSCLHYKQAGRLVCLCVTAEGHLRETEEERGGPDQEGGGSRHWDVSAGSEGAGRSGGGPNTSPDSPNSETWHGRRKEKKGRGRGGRGLLPACYRKAFFKFIRQNSEQRVCWGAAMTADRNTKSEATLSKALTNQERIGFTLSACLPNVSWH